MINGGICRWKRQTTVAGVAVQAASAAAYRPQLDRPCPRKSIKPTAVARPGIG
jgi:hypothetical protein